MRASCELTCPADGSAAFFQFNRTAIEAAVDEETGNVTILLPRHGMSEGALLCVAPAVAAAVRQATGAVIRGLPLTLERLWRALQGRRALKKPVVNPNREVRSEASRCL